MKDQVKKLIDHKELIKQSSKLSICNNFPCKLQHGIRVLGFKSFVPLFVVLVFFSVFGFSLESLNILVILFLLGALPVFGLVSIWVVPW
jgi:hypothetical protein